MTSLNNTGVCPSAMRLNIHPVRQFNSAGWPAARPALVPSPFFFAANPGNG
jgi:hypothetical protein